MNGALGPRVTLRDAFLMNGSWVDFCFSSLYRKERKKLTNPAL